MARWTSDETRRPLARRDAVRHPVYDHYLGVNRHALTPDGWVHEQDNAKRRRQGVIDELLDRSYDPMRYDEPGTTLTGERFTILDTRTDEFTVESAKRQAEDALARYPDIDGMIGLFAYNPPGILLALEGAGRLGNVTVIGFDEADETLQGIIDGHIYGTVVQNPYEYGRQSVRILAQLARDEEGALPEGGYLDIEARQIKRDNVEAFWADLREKMGTGDGG